MRTDEQDTLFSTSDTGAPLAQKMRPSGLENIVGQEHFLNENFKRLLTSDRWTGFVFWGPPGTGKTTLATVIARITNRPYQALSAVTSGVKEIREVLERSKAEVRSGRQAHILFIDEVHRLNKSQQDVLLPYLEEGSIRFIGATTENPSFEINNAIASRCVIFHFEPLSDEKLLVILKRAAREFPQIEAPVLDKIAQASLGDARRALTLLDHLVLSAPPGSPITPKDFEKLTHSQSLYYDKKSEAHYDTISAFIKSVRGSDPDAAVYYLARMLEAGEDPLFIARRLVILASEDIGNASPMGLVLATSAFQAAHSLGMPEARIVLSQATTYLACCEKSNRSYAAIEEAIQTVRQTGNLEIPHSIRNAPTKMMKDWGYGKGYKYAHNDERGWVEMQFLPDKIKDRRFYKPTTHGVEKTISDFLKRKGKTDVSDSTEKL
jgi:putative ATPase